jgi:putative transposase
LNCPEAFTNGGHLVLKHDRHHATGLIPNIQSTSKRVVSIPRYAGRKTGWIMLTTRRRHTQEQIVRKLVTAERVVAEGGDVAATCRELAVSEQTYYWWRNQYGGLKAEDAKRLKELEKQNAILKRLLAEAKLEKAALKELAEGNF